MEGVWKTEFFWLNNLLHAIDTFCSFFFPFSFFFQFAAFSYFLPLWNQSLQVYDQIVSIIQSSIFSSIQLNEFSGIKIRFCFPSSRKNVPHKLLWFFTHFYSQNEQSIRFGRKWVTEWKLMRRVSFPCIIVFLMEEKILSDFHVSFESIFLPKFFQNLVSRETWLEKGKEEK